MLEFWYYITDIFNGWIWLYIVNTILILTIIFNERKTPSATLAWIMIIGFVPIAGFIIYFIFNQNISRSKINRHTEKEHVVISNALKRQKDEIVSGTFSFKLDEAAKWRHLIKLNHVYGSSYYTQKNDIKIITDGKELFNELIDDIRKAQKSINLETYILKKDHLGKELIRELTKKVREGVEVRLLVDALGGRYITKVVLREYLRAGGKVGFFFKPKFIFFGVKLNYRNHRKIITIDNETAYIGGFNIGKEYVGEKRKFGYWRDTHIKIKGESVFDLNSRFILDWRFTTREKIEIEPGEYEGEIQGDKGVQIVSCGPDEPKEEVKRAFMRMITYAQKNVYIQTPYFVPDPSILESLKMAAQSGVDVRIMIPCKPDHIFVYWATYSYIGEMLKAGARVFIYENGFLHAKTMMVDGEVTSVGSSNFDIRSFRLNFETNAFVFHRGFAKQMEEIFVKDMSCSRELTLEDYNKRSIAIKIKEAISRLLSDLL